MSMPSVANAFSSLFVTKKRWRRQSRSQRNPARPSACRARCSFTHAGICEIESSSRSSRSRRDTASAYFCNSGMFSVLNVMPDGKSVEVGLIGKEGVSGTPLVAGFRASHTRTVVQADGTAFRMDADGLRAALPKCPTLERQMNRYAQLLAVQVTQIAACNRLHEVDERLARWLLMTQDRVGSESLPLTQEFLAQMLGTRRSSVTVSAGTLQKGGLCA